MKEIRSRRRQLLSRPLPASLLLDGLHVAVLVELDQALLKHVVDAVAGTLGLIGLAPGLKKLSLELLQPLLVAVLPFLPKALFLPGALDLDLGPPSLAADLQEVCTAALGD